VGVTGICEEIATLGQRFALSRRLTESFGRSMKKLTDLKATTETATHRSDLPPRDCLKAPA
jgi:hypothetical protein